MLSELLNARKVLAAIDAADQAGILELITRAPTSTDELAEQLGIAPDLLARFLQVLRWNGVLERHDERWSIATCLEGAFGATGAASHLPILRIERWAANDHLNADGIVAALRGDCRPPEIADEYIGALAEAMLVGARASAPHVVRLKELRDCHSLADVAGGTGGYAVGLCRLRGSLRATVYDRPAMLLHARRVVDDAGLADRVRLRTWDLHTDALEPGHDCALVSHVLHLLDREARADLLHRIRVALPRAGVLAVHDYVYDDPQPGTALAVSSIDWLSYGTGFTLSCEELIAELEDAGFSVDRTITIVPTSATLLVARCA